MIDVIGYILNLYPSGWLFYSQSIYTDFSKYGSASIDIRHPKNEAIELSISIASVRVGIAVLESSESDVEIDLGEFDYSFEQKETERLKEFLKNFFSNAELGIKFSAE